MWLIDVVWFLILQIFVAGQRWDDYGDYSTALDRGDPNYDSAEEEVAPAMVCVLVENLNLFLIPHRAQLFAKVEITLRQYKEAIKAIIKEYFTSEDSLEVATYGVMFFFSSFFSLLVRRRDSQYATRA